MPPKLAAVGLDTGLKPAGGTLDLGGFAGRPLTGFA
jgi:hypothetical protein